MNLAPEPSYGYDTCDSVSFHETRSAQVSSATFSKIRAEWQCPPNTEVFMRS